MNASTLMRCQQQQAQSSASLPIKRPRSGLPPATVLFKSASLQHSRAPQHPSSWPSWSSASRRHAILAAAAGGRQTLPQGPAALPESVSTSLEQAPTQLSPQKLHLARLVGMAAVCGTLLSSLLAAPSAHATQTATVSAAPVAEIASAAAAVCAGDTAWVLTSTALVLFMTVPGLSLFYAGLVKQKNVLSVLMHCFAITALMTVVWAVAGYSLSFSAAGMQEGVVNVASFIGNLDKAFLNGVSLNAVQGTIPETLWVMFQMTFAIITPALVVGAFAERMKFSAMMLFTLLWAFVVYFPAAHSVWGGAGSFFGDMGVMDFAGGIVVHITAGIAALVACIMVGPRKVNTMEPHNLAMTVTGTGMLWVGWYGFNAGSAVSAGAAAAMAMAVTQISAAVASLVWMFLDATDPAIGRPSVLGICTGAIAGLAAITPASGFVGPMGAFTIGTVSAIVCRYFATTVKAKFGYDDSLDVFGVHGVGGFVGTVLVAVFASSQFGGLNPDLDIAKALGVQLFAAVSVGLYTAVASWGVLKVVEVVCGGLRVEEEEEMLGLDQGTHGELGYEITPSMMPNTLTA